MYIISEASSVTMSTPKKIKKVKDKIRMECILQTYGDINRNRRRYGRKVLEEAVKSVNERIREGTFLGELDHPIDQNPVRQVTVLYKNCSHRILDTGWSGNKLIGVVETLNTPNGQILKNLAMDIPVGFSFRGMGEVKQLNENGETIFEVTGPLVVITWDSVSFPSHKEARMIKITEGVAKTIQESVGFNCYHESDGRICTPDGICYLPNDFDKLVERKMIDIKKKYWL